MKKFWKLSVCALAATFTLSSITACGDKGETEERSNITADQVLALGDSIAESLDGVKSFNFGLSMKTEERSSGYSMENSIDAQALFNITASGVDMKATVSMTDKMSMDDIPDFNYSESESLSAYIIDGFAYTQDEEDSTGKTYTKSSVSLEKALDEIFQEEFDMNLSDILEEIMSAEGEIEIPEIPVDLIKEILNDEFTLIQKGDTTRVTLDLKEEFNDIFRYIGNLSVNTRLGDMVNYALGHIDEDLKWQDITSAIKDKGGYTVGTFVNVLDNELYNASGMHLQDLKDTLLAEPDMYAMLVEEFGTETAELIVNITVADLVSEYGALTVDNILQMSMDDETATLSSVVGQFESMLTQTTLGDMMDVDVDAAVFNEMISMFKGVHADALNANLIFTVKNDKVTRVEVSYNVKISVSAQGQSMMIGMSYSAYAENFSLSMQTIVLPMGATVNIYCNDCGWTATEGDYCAGCQAYRCGDCHDQNEHNG